MSVIAPSGEQVEIESGDQRAVVVGVGAGLRAYAVGGRNVVDGYGVDEMATAGRGQVLIPWPNRLQDGRYEFEGRRHQLPLNEPEHANAIHGLVRWSAWSVAARESERVVMEHRLHPQPGYPFTLDLSIEYALSDRAYLFGRQRRTSGPIAVRTDAERIRTSASAPRPSMPRFCTCPLERCSRRTTGAFRRAGYRSSAPTTTFGNLEPSAQ